MRAAAVIQAFFPGRKPPAQVALQRFERTLLSPLPEHPAQRRPSTASAPIGRSAIDHRFREPHAAVAVQRSSAFGLPPHPATVARQSARAPRSASVQAKTPVRAFRTPEGFLDGQQRGEALPPAVKRQMEHYFETDFSDVRIHVGSEASAIGALAFTLGTDLYFAPNQYQPHTLQGCELIGHELAHVVQQREGRVGNPFGDGVAVVHDEELEAEADEHGRAAARIKISSLPGRVQRSPSLHPHAQHIQQKSASAKGVRNAQLAKRSGSLSDYQLVVGA